MVTRYGMNADLGHATYEAEHSPFIGAPQTATRTALSEATLKVIDAAVRDLVGAAFERACSLLQQHRAVLERAAERLLLQETLERQDLDALRAELAAGATVAGCDRAA